MKIDRIINAIKSTVPEENRSLPAPDAARNLFTARLVTRLSLEDA